MKMWIDRDEAYPVYSLWAEDPCPSSELVGIEVEVTQKEADAYSKARQEYNRVQMRLEKLFKDAKGKDKEDAWFKEHMGK